MPCAVVDERDRASLHRVAIDLELPLAGGDRTGLANLDDIHAATVPKGDRVGRPPRRRCRSNREHVAGLVKSEDCLESDAVHPARGSRIPRPPTPSEMTGSSVDI